MSAREHAIAAGVIVPGIVAPSLRTGDPSPQRWVDAPTLRLDRLATLAIEMERAETSRAGLP